MYASRISSPGFYGYLEARAPKGLSAHLYQTVHIIPPVARQQDMYHNNASYTDISSRRTVVPCSGFTVGSQQWRALLRLFDGFSGEFVNFGGDAMQVQDFLPHETIDDPAGCLVTYRISLTSDLDSYQLATAAIMTPPTEIEMFKIFVTVEAGVCNELLLVALKTNDLLVSMCDLVSPSDRSARREPTNTNMAIFGKTTKVARKNCHRATDWMDWVPQQSRSAGLSKPS